MTGTASFFATSGVTTAQAATIGELLASVEDFETKYLGPKAADPTTDNDGGVLIDGALYFNTVSSSFRAWDTGTLAWSTPTGATGATGATGPAGANGTGLTDGDKGDITVSAAGLTFTIDSNVISTYGRTLTDDIDAATARTTLGLGTLATQSGTFSGSSSGTNTGDETAAGILAKLVTVDGAASGLDADLLDGNSSAAFGLVANPLSQFAATTSLQLAGVLSDETGSGALVFATSPTLVTPALGTPSALVLTNATGLPLAAVLDSTTEALGVGSLELGHATDTTIARTAAGVVAVEGNRLLNVLDRATIGAVIDGGGVAITTGIKGDIGPFTFACTIEDVTLLADQSGSIVIDIWKQAYASFPPLVAQTITAAAKPTITTATKSQDTTLTGWTTAIAVGDILRFNVDSITTCQRVALTMKIKRT